MYTSLKEGIRCLIRGVIKREYSLITVTNLLMHLITGPGSGIKHLKRGTAVTEERITKTPCFVKVAQNRGF